MLRAGVPGQIKDILGPQNASDPARSMSFFQKGTNLSCIVFYHFSVFFQKV